MNKVKIQSSAAPTPIGPYSQAIALGNLVFVSGQVALKADGSNLLDKPVAEQTKLVLENVQRVLASGGSSLDQVVKTTVFLTDMNDFAEMNNVYGQFFKDPFPARSAVQVAALPRGARVEIEAIAVI